MSAIEWLEGPLWQVSAAVFVIFGLWRIAHMLVTGRRRPKPKPAGSPALGAIATIFRHFVPSRVVTDRKMTWFVTIMGYSFHLGLFALLFFAAPHVAFIESHILGFGWEAMPRWAFIVSAEFAFAGLLALWLRRLVDPVLKFISRPDDRMADGLTFVVMLTGCLALGQQSVFLRGLHLGLVELWLVYFPFSSLMHTFTWPLSRGFSGAAAGRRGTSA